MCVFIGGLWEEGGGFFVGYFEAVPKGVIPRTGMGDYDGTKVSRSVTMRKGYNSIFRKKKSKLLFLALFYRRQSDTHPQLLST